MPTPATVYLSESNGAGEVVTDNISNLNFGGVDLPNLVPGNHPVVKPGVNRFNAFFKALRIKVQSLGDSIQIQDFRAWRASGTLKAEEAILMGIAPGTTAYDQPAQTDLAHGSANMPTADPGAANLYTKAVASLLPITAADGPPVYTPYFFLQWVGNNVNGGTTPFGAMNQKTFAFTYAES